MRLLERVGEFEKLDRRFRETAIAVIDAIVVREPGRRFDALEQATLIRDQLQSAPVRPSVARSRITDNARVAHHRIVGVRRSRRSSASDFVTFMAGDLVAASRDRSQPRAFHALIAEWCVVSRRGRELDRSQQLPLLTGSVSSHSLVLRLLA